MSTVALRVPHPHRLDRLLLLCAVAVPFLYYGTMLAASLLYPGYSHVTQYASELGSASARYPMVFNTGMVLGGIAAVLGGVGVFRALRKLGRGPVLPLLLSVAIVLQGVGFIFGGLFPMPDERHGGYGLGMAGLLGPLFAAIALLRAPDGLRWVPWFLAVNAVATLALFAVMMGVGELVTRAVVGLYQRAFSLTSMPWIGVAGWALLRWLRMTATR